jgi:hypothetical protein
VSGGDVARALVARLVQWALSGGRGERVRGLVQLPWRGDKAAYVQRTLEGTAGSGMGGGAEAVRAREALALFRLARGASAVAGVPAAAAKNSTGAPSTARGGLFANLLGAAQGAGQLAGASAGL